MAALEMLGCRIPMAVAMNALVLAEYKRLKVEEVPAPVAGPREWWPEWVPRCILLK